LRKLSQRVPVAEPNLFGAAVRRLAASTKKKGAHLGWLLAAGTTFVFALIVLAGSDSTP